MPLTPITLASTLEPFRLRLASTPQSSVQVVAPTIVTFLDDSSTVAYQPGNPASIVAKSIYDGATTIDGTSDKWLLLAVKGTAWPVWVKERDLGTIETLVSAKGWAPLRMLAEGRLHPLFLESQAGGPALPTEVDGAVLYGDPTTHQWVALSPAKGDLLRGEQDPGGLPMWRRLPGGNPLNVLYMDPATGLPTWVPLATLVAPLIPVPSSGSNLSAKALSLWNGTSNNAPPTDSLGNPWYAVAFNDSAWPQGVQPNIGTEVVVPGGIWIWPTVNPASRTDQCLIRQRFTLPNGPITSATITIDFDDLINGVWLNGTRLSITGHQYVPGPAEPIPTSLLIADGVTQNVIAIWGVNNSPPTGNNYAMVSWVVSTS